jgi:benzoate-CoA ligase family protein
MPPDRTGDLPARVNIADEFITRPAREHPERIAILGEPAEVRYREVAELVARVASALHDSGCGAGDRVLIVLPDSLEFIAAFFGAAKIGAISVPVNSLARSADYRHYLTDSGAKFLIVHASVLDRLAPAAEGVSITRAVIAGSSERRLGQFGTSEVSWEDWLSGRADVVASHPTAATDPAFFLYTSGSGGTPKAAIHRHQDMLVTSRSFALGVLGLRADDRTFSVSKLFFAYGLGNGMYFPFSVGASTVLHPDRPRVDKIAELVGRYRPTVFFSVPTFYASLLREAGREMVERFSSVRMAVSAGEALPAEIFNRFRERFGIEILDGIGSTEMLHMFLSCRPGHARPGTCGLEVPGCEARVLDDSGEPVPTGEIGNLWVKGQSAFAGYWNIPELTARTKRGDWVLTGDKFFRDADGFYHYCGRADDMMKVSGMWVSPGEVENALLGHPAVAEAAVVARADSLGLLRATAYVVLRDGAASGSPLVTEIQAWVRARLVSYKCPQEIEFVGELPKTATGKIQRFRLRQSADEQANH